MILIINHYLPILPDCLNVIVMPLALDDWLAWANTPVCYGAKKSSLPDSKSSSSVFGFFDGIWNDGLDSCLERLDRLDVWCISLFNKRLVWVLQIDFSSSVKYGVDCM